MLQKQSDGVVPCGGANWGGLICLLVLLGLPACRAASPTGQTPLHLARIHSGTPLDRSTTTFTSTTAELRPIQDTMRGALAFGGDLTGTGLQWDFAGSTEDYTPRISGPGSHSSLDHGPLAPVTIANFATLQNELSNLRAVDSNVANLLNVPALPPLPTNNLLRSFALNLSFDRTRVRWVSGTSATPNAALRIDVPLEVVVTTDDLISPMFEVGPYTMTLPVTIDVQPCGACTTRPGAACSDAPGVIASGYRTGIATALGYSASDVDATYPDLRLNFSTRPVVRASPLSGSTSYTAACPFIVAQAPTASLLDAFNLDATDPTIAALALLLDWGRSAVGGLKYIAGLIACDIIAGLTRRQVEPLIAALPSQLTTGGSGGGRGSLIDLLVNPPVLDTTVARLGAASVMGGFVAGTVLDRARVHAAIVVGPRTPPPIAPIVPSIPATGPIGGYTDVLFNTVATGGCATATTTIDMRPVIQACAAGIGLSVGDSSTICTACAPGGLCARGSCSFLCDGMGAFRPSTTVPGATTSSTRDCAAAGLEIAPAPNLASLLSTAPLFGETIRRWFDVLPGGGRYTSSAPGPTPGTASFGYMIDPDDDCVPQASDICPNTFDPAQLDDGDGDIYGAACDACIGVRDSSALANADLDGDGIANACDSDLDGDGCPNSGPGVDGLSCGASTGTVFDRSPWIASSANFDGDCNPDDCDNDRDADGVLEAPTDGTAPDNCPLGDGDGVFEAGVTMDQNPSQTNSGGLPEGDICDRLCPYPGAPGCNLLIHGGGSFAAGPSSMNLIPGPTHCVGLSGGVGSCDLTVFLLCPGQEYDRCWLPDAFDSLSFVDRLGQTVVQIDALQMGFTGGFASSTALLPDIDGDGRDELVVAAPRSSVCPDGKQCFGTPGLIAILGSQHGKLITRMMGSESGALFGAAMASLGNVLAVGAPRAGGGAGAVYLYRASGDGLQLVSVIAGDGGTDALGSDVAAAFGADTSAPSFLIGAPGARSGAGRMVIANASQGITHRFEAPFSTAHMSHGVVVGSESNFTVVAGIPDADAGSGALAFFRAHGAPRVIHGGVGSRLGERLVAVDGTDIVASSPGSGLVTRYARTGASLGSASSTLPFFGTGLAAPGDLDGDGRIDLVVGFAVDASGDDLGAIDLLRVGP